MGINLVFDIDVRGERSYVFLGGQRAWNDSKIVHCVALRYSVELGHIVWLA
jgi:hypothetical protein